MDKLGMDAEKIWDQMQGNGVTGGDTWDLFTHFGCPINNSPHPKDRKVVMEYLYHFFEEWSRTKKTKYFTVEIGGLSGYVNGYNWIDIKLTTHYTKPSGYGSWKTSNWKEKENYLFTFSVWYDHPNGTYREITVEGLQQLYLTNTRDGYQLARVDNWNSLYMEVQRDLINKIKILHKERFLQACFRGTAIVVKREKVPFYASSAWKFIFVVVTVILIGISLQVQLVGVTATLGLAQGTIATTLITTVLKLTTSFLISFTGNLVSDGNFIVTVLTTILTFALFGFDWKDLGTFDKILKVTSSVQKIQSAYEQMNAKEDYMDGYKDYLETPKERQERLEDEYLGMDRNSGIDAHVAILRSSGGYMFAETPDQFLNRTKETNPGMRVVESVGNFVDIMLQLPKDRLPPQPQPKEAL